MVYKFKLSVLRDIGWQYWDPIGLMPKGETWQDNLAFADEYDTYLMRAAGRLARGEDEKDIAKYLTNLAQDAMGLSFSNSEAAKETAAQLVATKAQWLVKK